MLICIILEIYNLKKNYLKGTDTPAVVQPTVLFRKLSVSNPLAYQINIYPIDKRIFETIGQELVTAHNTMVGHVAKIKMIMKEPLFCMKIKP